MDNDMNSDNDIHDENHTPENNAVQTDANTQSQLQASYDQLLKQCAAQMNLNKEQNKEHEKEMQHAVKYANAKIIKELTSLLDVFELALTHNPEDQGILMLQKQFINILSKYGLILISPQPGDVFDPYQHFALSTTSSDTLQNNQIASIMQNGYSLHNQVIKEAKVVIVKNELEENESKNTTNNEQ